MVTQFNRENYVKNLPDAYQKAKGSNNDKILAIEKSAADRLREAIGDIYDSLDINKAYGKTLDYYGEMYELERGGKTDDQFRIAILQQIAISRCTGDYDNIVNVLSLVISAPAEDFLFEDAEEGGKVDVEKFPYDSLQAAGITVPQAWQMLATLLPAGVRATGFNVTHEVNDAAPKLASVVTLAENHVVKVDCRFYEEVGMESVTAASTVTHEEKHTMEVLS